MENQQEVWDEIAEEWYEFKTGERHEGMFYSITTLARKLTSAGTVPLIGLVLEFTGYKPFLDLDLASI